MSLLVVLEVLSAVLGTTMFIRHMGISSSDAFSRAVILVLGGLSGLISLLLMAGQPQLLWLADAGCIGLFVSALACRGDQAVGVWHDIREVYTLHPWYILWPCVLLLTLLFLEAILLAPSNNDGLAYNITRAWLMLDEGRLYLHSGNGIRQQVFPPAFDVLFTLLLRSGGDYGTGVFSFLSYLAILCGTYNLANRLFHSPRIGLATALAGASFTEVLLQATTVKNDIPTAAAAITLLAALYNIINVRNATPQRTQGFRFHVIYVVFAVIFGVVVKTYFLGMAAALFACIGVGLLLSKRLFSIGGMIFHSLRRPGLSGIIGLILCLGLLIPSIFMMTQNSRLHGGLFGPTSFTNWHKNADGVTGAAINAGRYTLQLLDAPNRLTRYTAAWYDNQLGEAKSLGTNMNFADLVKTPLFPQEDLSAFSMLGFLLVVASLLVTLIKGRGFVRQTAVAAILSFGAICYALAWMPWNLRFFSATFILTLPACGFFISRMKRPWSVTVLMLYFVGHMWFVGLTNAEKLILNILDFPHSVGWAEANDLLRRTWDHPYHYARYGLSLEDRETLLHLTAPGDRVLILYHETSLVLPLLLALHDRDITLTRPGRPLITDSGTLDTADCDTFFQLSNSANITVEDIRLHSKCTMDRRYYARSSHPDGMLIFTQSNLNHPSPRTADLFNQTPEFVLASTGVESIPHDHHLWMYGNTSTLTIAPPHHFPAWLEYELMTMIKQQHVQIFLDDKLMLNSTKLYPLEPLQGRIALPETTQPLVVRFVFDKTNTGANTFAPEDPRPLTALLEQFHIVH